MFLESDETHKKLSVPLKSIFFFFVVLDEFGELL